MIGLGLATGLLEAGTALPYLGAIGIMGTAGLAASTWAPMLAAYNLVMVLPPVLLYLGHRVLGERLRPRQYIGPRAPPRLRGVQPPDPEGCNFLTLRGAAVRPRGV